jgi:hypothetical protein
MVQARGNSRLFKQHRDKSFFLSQVGMQNLDGIESLKSAFSRVPTQIHIGHPAMP